MKLKTGLFALLVLSVAGYGGAKYYLHTQIKSKLDQLESMTHPFVQISYGSITSDLRGKLQIDNIGLKASEGASLQVESISLEGPGPRFLWDLINNFKNNEPPDSLILKLSKVWFPVGQDFSGSFGPKAFDGQDVAGGQPQPCTLEGIFKHAGLEQIGTESLVVNSVMGYKLSKSSGMARVFLDFEVVGLESMSMTMTLQGIPEPGAVVMGVMPSFSDVDLTYSLQSGYIKRMVGHCAQQAGQSNEQFLDSLFDQSDSQITRNLGFAPGPGIKQMLRTLLSSGGTVQLTANPGDDFDPVTLSAYKPEDIMRLLKIEVSLNDKSVKDLSMAFVDNAGVPSGAFEQSGLGLGAGDSAYETGDVEINNQQERHRMRYVETRIADLHDYIGSRVKLYTKKTGIPKQGFLARAKGGTFSVEQSIHGGMLTAHVRATEISRAEVLRLVP